MDENIASSIPPELTDAVKNAMADPRFGEIFKMVAAARPTSSDGDDGAKKESDSAGIDGLMALIGGAGEGSHTPSAGDGRRSLPAILDMSEDKKRLLLALKPFLNHKRAAAIDGLLKIYEMGGIASALGLFQNL